MPDTQAVSVGDAVLTFLADTTQLDQGIDSIEGKVSSMAVRLTGDTTAIGQGFNEAGDAASSAADEMEEAGEKASGSLHEARGEAALLGEAFGVHLPRHVRSFVAELPGVSEALSSAFAATAILFVIEAVVKLTEKVTEFVSTTFIYTEAMKAADAATASLNKQLLENKTHIEDLNRQYDEMTMSPLQLLTKALDAVNEKIEEQGKSFRNASDQLFASRNGMIELTEAQKTMYENIVASNGSTMEALADQNRNLSTQIQKIYDDDAKKHADMLKKELKDTDAYNEEVKLKMMQTVDEIDDGVRNLVKGRPALPEMLGNVDDFKKYEDAASALGITLKSSLVTALEAAKKAQADLISSGKALPEELKEAQAAVKTLQDQVNNFGNETPKVNAFFEAFKKGGEQSEAAAWGFGNAYGDAIGKVIAGEEGLGAAMEQATKQFIGQIGARALVQGMFYLAQGIADAVWAPEKAAADFAASAEFLALGALATGIGAAIPGGSSGGGSGSGFQGTGRNNPNSPIQTTGSTSQSVATSTNVQRFASGGLVTQQTLAMLGDSESGGDATEAVIPLHQDSKAVAAIADALASRMGNGGGPSFHVNVKGMISDDNLTRVMKRMSRKVKKGTGLIQSSNTLRITKRSA